MPQLRYNYCCIRKSFEHTFEMWYFQVKEPSIDITKYLMLSLRSRAWHDPSLLLIFIILFFSFEVLQSCNWFSLDFSKACCHTIP